MTKHIADQRSQTTGGRTKAFLRLARTGRETFHRHSAQSTGTSRLQQFLRIARGRTV